MFTKILPESFPMKPGESWWIIHPNNAYAEFIAPVGAMTICKEDFLNFKRDILYMIIGNDNNNGWITLKTEDMVVLMPYYVFARYFDAEVFIKNIAQVRVSSNRDIEKFYG
jgi:hypothetical protein